MRDRGDSLSGKQSVFQARAAADSTQVQTGAAQVGKRGDSVGDGWRVTYRRNRGCRRFGGEDTVKLEELAGPAGKEGQQLPEDWKQHFTLSH